jgi:hypothetical protein
MCVKMSCISVPNGGLVVQYIVLFNVENSDYGRMRAPKHVDANKWEKKKIYY